MTDSYGNPVDEETLIEDSYEGHDYRIVQTNDPDELTANMGGEQYVLFVDDIGRATAGKLKESGWSEPWPDALERYAFAYIDGFEKNSKASLS